MYRSWAELTTSQIHVIDSAVTNNSKCFKQTHKNTDNHILKYLLFLRSTIEWNYLTDSQVNAVTVEAFKSQIKNY